MSDRAGAGNGRSGIALPGAGYLDFDEVREQRKYLSDAESHIITTLIDEIERLRNESGILAKRCERRSTALADVNRQLAAVRKKFKRMSHERDLLKRDGDGDLLAENQRMTAALERLAEWDMLHLGPDGHGTATADAPWARALIEEALNG